MSNRITEKEVQVLALPEVGNKVFLDTSLDAVSLGEFGSMSWNVKLTRDSYRSKKKMKLRHSITSDLRITDCSRPITLSFYADSVKSAEARISKLQNMIDQLEAMKTAYQDAVELMDAEHDADLPEGVEFINAPDDYDD